MRVEARNVTKTFGRIEALRDVSFDLQSGERVALIGPNGAGKSTLTRSLMGMLSFEGTVLLDGLSPASDRMKLAHRMAYVPQIAPRLAATVEEVVAAASQLRGLTPSSILEVASRLGLDVESKRHESSRNLSGGMRQKLLLALALSTDADLLILDEPTASLDVESRQSFFDIVNGLERKPTLLLCSHRIEELRHLVDKVLVLDEGRLVFFGPATDYLGRFAGGVLEVRATSTSHDEWLEQMGFRRRRTGWWTLWVQNGRRSELVREISSRLGDDIADIVVRDLETMTPRSPEETGP